VGLKNDFLDDDVVTIIEEENLNEDETRKLENSASRILEVIKREDRIDKIARDIAHHFPRRGFLGKGMVVSVDKYTAVKMYDKVSHYWGLEKQKVMQERNAAQTQEERDRLTGILNYMDRVEMAVIVSEEADEVEKFKKQGLDITKHRQKMNEITPEGADIEDRFKDPNDPLQLVFVCAMWLTGFDVENLSTLYLDKPMKGHTLMQAIARANRVYPGKPCGIIVDYVNVFKYMQKALTEYATGDDGTEFPAKDIDQLIALINNAVDEADEFLLSLGVDMGALIAKESTLDQLALLDAYNIIVSKDDNKEKFKVILNTLMNLYEASRPEIFEKDWRNDKFAPLAYLFGLFNHTIDDEKINRARRKLAQTLDFSVTAQRAEDNDDGFVIHQGKVIDLSKVNVDALRKEIKTAKYKAIEIDDLKAFIERALEQALRRNVTRQAFSERFRGIIDKYNAGGSENEEYYEQLLKLIEDLKKEDKRADAEGLTEEELEIYDLLIAGKKLTKEEEQKVKLSAKNLYKKLSESKKELMVVDWYKDEQPRARVKSAIETSLDADLPRSYDKETFSVKIDLLLSHFIDMAVQGYGWVA
ncbi:MAG: type I restriction endonuclease subunit R, partial [Thermoguttaceae bacterium]|nr:type I restriction endonuclease subunit R [Thermoguttaceae bacterium]